MPAPVLEGVNTVVLAGYGGVLLIKVDAAGAAAGNVAFAVIAATAELFDGVKAALLADVDPVELRVVPFAVGSGKPLLPSLR